jgi:hypothetical protein
MRLMLPAAWNAARYRLGNAGGGSSGPWANPFDNPSGTVLWSRWINGSPSGTARDNCVLWSNRAGFSGPTSACEWRTNAGSGRANVELLNWEELSAGPMIVRLRCKVETYAVAKVWLLFNTVFANPLWELYVDVTPDGTTPTNRIGHHSPEWSDVWVEEHPSHLGWMFIKARLNLTGASDVDGSFTVHMADANDGDELFPLDTLTVIRVQDLTIEQA